jgi:hypothetical protein
VVPMSLPAAPRRCRCRKKILGRFIADQSKYYRLYLHIDMVTLAAMYLRRIRVTGRCFAAARAHVSTIVPPAPAAQNLGVGLRQPCRGQTSSRIITTRKMYSGAEES